MEVLGVILIIIIMILVMVIFCIPTIAMVAGLRWGAERLLTNTNRWVKWGSVLMFMLVMPQIFNVLINRDVTNILASSDFRPTVKVPVDILAVKPLKSQRTKRAICEKDCALLLLSDEIEQYLVVEPNTKGDVQKVTSFQFEDRSDCDLIDFLGRNMRSKLENIIREMSLSGRCLTSTESTLDIADVLVEYSSIKPDGKFLSRIKGLRTSVSRRNTSNGDWVEIQGDIGAKYREVFPVLLPAFSYANEKGPVDVLTTIKYRRGEKKFHCNNDWFSDYVPCHRRLSVRPASAVLGLSVSTYRLEKDGVIGTEFDLRP